MHLGALIVTTGLQEDAGVASLLKPVGTVNAGQRMIAVFRCSGVHCTGLVLEKKDRKDRRQLTQDGVLFFQAETGASPTEGAQLGLRCMAGKYDRIFLVPGSHVLFLPETLCRLLNSSADVVIPTCSQGVGYPILLSRDAVRELLEAEPSLSLEQAVSGLSGSKEWVSVSDPGIMAQDLDNNSRKELAENQARQLLRPAAQVQLQMGSLCFDKKLAELLHLIDETHSVRQASSLMQISYSAAWGILNSADEFLDDPLLLRKRGGQGGSGCELSPKGRLILNAYDQYSAAVSQEAQHLYEEIFADFLDR